MLLLYREEYGLAGLVVREISSLNVEICFCCVVLFLSLTVSCVSINNWGVEGYDGGGGGRTAHLSCIVVWMCLFMYACMCVC